MKTAAVLAFVGAVVAAPNVQERQIDPLSASLAVFQALPSSLQALAITNPAAVASEVSSEFATGTPAWFSSLPTDVQSYFISVGEAGNAVATSVSASAAASTGGATNFTISSTSRSVSNATALITSTGSSTSTSSKTTTSTTKASASTAASYSSSSGMAALPTQIVAGGIAGVAGLMAILAL